MSRSNPRSVRAGRVLVAVGIALILWAVLYLCSRALGGPPEELAFAHRRSYDQVKGAVHEAFPGLLLRGLPGVLLLALGLRLASRVDG